MKNVYLLTITLFRCTTQGFFNLLFIVPVIFYLLFSIFVVIYTTRKLLRTGLPQSLNNRLNLVGRLAFYTLFFVILWIIPIINRIANMVSFVSGASFAPVDLYFEGAGYVTEGIMPLIDVLVFGSHPAIVNFILCRKRKNEIVEIEEDVDEQDYAVIKANRRKSRYYRIKDINPYGLQVPIHAMDDVKDGTLNNPLLDAKDQPTTPEASPRSPENAPEIQLQTLPPAVVEHPQVPENSSTGTMENMLEDVTHEKKLSTRKKKVTILVPSKQSESSSLGINIDAVIRQDMMYCIMLGINEVVC